MTVLVLFLEIMRSRKTPKTKSEVKNMSQFTPPLS